MNIGALATRTSARISYGQVQHLEPYIDAIDPSNGSKVQHSYGVGVITRGTDPRTVREGLLGGKFNGIYPAIGYQINGKGVDTVHLSLEKGVFLEVSSHNALLLNGKEGRKPNNKELSDAIKMAMSFGPLSYEVATKEYNSDGKLEDVIRKVAVTKQITALLSLHMQ